MDYQATAIILKVQKLGDSDKILSLYSQEHGLIKAVAKGAFKVTSKFCAKTDVLNLGEFLIAKGRNLDIVKEIKINNSFRKIRQNYTSLSSAFLLVDILDHIAIKDEDYQTPFTLLKTGLEKIDSSSTDPNLESLLSVIQFQWNLIDFLGYKPELNFCSISQIKRTENQIPEYFDFENGSITSRDQYESFCEENPYQDQIKPINKNAFKVLNYLDHKEDINLSSSNFNADEMASAIKLLHRHLEYRLHKEFKSWKILEACFAVSTL